MNVFIALNSLAPEADKSTITCNAYKPYTWTTKIDISACLPEAFSSGYWLRLDIQIVPDQILVRTWKLVPNLLGPGAVYISTQNFGLLLQ